MPWRVERRDAAAHDPEHSGQPGLVARTRVDGVAGEDASPDLRADQGSIEERRSKPRANSRARERGSAGGLGLASRCGPPAGTRHASAARRVDARVDRYRSCVPEILSATASDIARRATQTLAAIP